MKKRITILLLLALLLTPAQAKKAEETPAERAARLALEAEAIAWAMQPPLVPSFTQTGSNHYLPDGTPTDTAPSGETVAYTDAAGNLWREDYFDASGTLTGYTVHQFDVDFVPQTITPAPWDFSGSRINAEIPPAPGYVRLEKLDYHADGSFEYGHRWRYDNTGAITERHYNNNGTYWGIDSQPYQNMTRNTFMDELSETYYDADGTEVYSLDHWGGDDGPAGVYETFYNEQGDVATVIAYSPEGIITERTDFFYDAVLENPLTLTHGADGEISHGDVPTYDAQGRLVRVDHYSSSKLDLTTTYHYDAEGVLREVSIRNQKGVLCSRTSYIDYSDYLKTGDPNGDVSCEHHVYILDDETGAVRLRAYYSRGRLLQARGQDTAGNRIRSFYSDVGEPLRYSDFCAYNEEGEKYLSIGLEEDGTIRSWSIFDASEDYEKALHWDADGFRREETHYDENDFTILHQEWANDTLMKDSRRNGDESHSYTRSEDGTLYLSHRSRYDLYGNLVSSLSYDERGEVTSETRYDLQYDLAGNLTAKYEYQNDRLQAYTLQTWGRLADQPAPANTERIDIPDPIQPPAPQPGQVLEYNAIGNVVADYRYDEDGNFLEGREYEYDRNGLKKEWICCSDEGDYAKRIEYGYQYQELVSKKEYLGDSDILTRTQYWTYQSDMLQTYIDTTYEDGEALRRYEETYTYRGDRLCVSEYTYEDGEAVLIDETSWTYRYEEDLLTERRESKQGAIVSCETFTYTEGLPSCTMTYDGEGRLTQRTDTVYGAYENILWTQTISAEGEILSRTDYFYDDDGNLITIR